LRIPLKITDYRLMRYSVAGTFVPNSSFLAISDPTYVPDTRERQRSTANNGNRPLDLTPAHQSALTP
jgi:hypothetical protein